MNNNVGTSKSHTQKSSLTPKQNNDSSIALNNNNNIPFFLDDIKDITKGTSYERYNKKLYEFFLYYDTVHDFGGYETKIFSKNSVPDNIIQCFMNLTFNNMEYKYMSKEFIKINKLINTKKDKYNNQINNRITDLKYQINILNNKKYNNNNNNLSHYQAIIKTIIENFGTVKTKIEKKYETEKKNDALIYLNKISNNQNLSEYDFNMQVNILKDALTLFNTIGLRKNLLDIYKDNINELKKGQAMFYFDVVNLEKYNNEIEELKKERIINGNVNSLINNIILTPLKMNEKIISDKAMGKFHDVTSYIKRHPMSRDKDGLADSYVKLIYNDKRKYSSKVATLCDDKIKLIYKDVILKNNNCINLETLDKDNKLRSCFVDDYKNVIDGGKTSNQNIKFYSKRINYYNEKIYLDKTYELNLYIDTDDETNIDLNDNKINFYICKDKIYNNEIKFIKDICILINKIDKNQTITTEYIKLIFDTYYENDLKNEKIIKIKTSIKNGDNFDDDFIKFVTDKKPIVKKDDGLQIYNNINNKYEFILKLSKLFEKLNHNKILMWRILFALKRSGDFGQTYFARMIKQKQEKVANFMFFAGDKSMSMISHAFMQLQLPCFNPKLKIDQKTKIGQKRKNSPVVDNSNSTVENKKRKNSLVVDNSNSSGNKLPKKNKEEEIKTGGGISYISEHNKLIELFYKKFMLTNNIKMTNLLLKENTNSALKLKIDSYKNISQNEFFHVIFHALFTRFFSENKDLSSHINYLKEEVIKLNKIFITNILKYDTTVNNFIHQNNNLKYDFIEIFNNIKNYISDEYDIDYIESSTTNSIYKHIDEYLTNKINMNKSLMNNNSNKNNLALWNLS